MGFEDFFLQSNSGKKIRFEDLKNLKAEDIAQNPALKKIITLFDKDGSGNIDTPDEWNTVFGELKNVAQTDGDKVLSYSEMGLFLQNKSISEEMPVEIFDELIGKIFDENSETRTESYQEDGVNFESEITTFGGKIQKMVRKQDGVVISTTEYKYNEDGTVKLITKSLNNILTETVVDSIEDDGNYLASNFVSRKTTMPNGNVIEISQLESGHIVETVKSNNTELTTIYNTASVYAYDYFKDEAGLKLAQVYTKGDKEYVVKYANGNTITHAASGDGIERLVRRLGFENAEQLYELNPELKNKIVKVGQEIVVPKMLNANDPTILRQGTLQDEYLTYLKHAHQENIKTFKNENFANINQEFFALLQSLKGFELNNENVQMYYKINLLDDKVQQELMNVFEVFKGSNARENLPPYDIKKMILTSDLMPKEKLEDGSEASINLFAGPVFTLKNPMNGVGEIFTYEIFIKEQLGLDITSGEGKDLYERMLKIDDYQIINDLIVMFDNIGMRNNEELYANFVDKMTDDYRVTEVENSKFAEGVQLAKNQNKFLSSSEAIEMSKNIIYELTEPPKRTKHHDYVENMKDSYLRQFTAEMVKMMWLQGSDAFGNAYANEGFISVCKSNYKKGRDNYNEIATNAYYNLKRDVALGNDKMSKTLQSCCINSYDKEKIRRCFDIVTNENSTEEEKQQAILMAFGNQIAESVEETISNNQFWQNVWEIGSMIIGTGLIGKGITWGLGAIKGVGTVQKAAVMFNGVSKGQKIANFATQMGISSATFAIYDGLKYTIDYHTNEIDEMQLGEHSYSYLEGLGTTVSHSVAFGAFASAWGQLITSNLLKSLFKTPQAAQISAEAMRGVEKTFAKSTQFTSSQLMQSFTKAQAKVVGSLGKEVVSFGSELVGFSLWEGTNQYITSNGDKTIYEIFKGQFETLLSFKAVGALLRMRIGGKGFGAINEFGKIKPLEFEPVSEKGKTGYKVKYPDGKESFVKDINEAVALSNTYYENKTLYEPLEEILKNEKVDLGEGIVISKEGDNYVIDLNGRTRISEPNLKVAMLKAQNQHSFYKLEQRVRTGQEVTLPNKIKITFDKENNMFETTLESGTKVRAENVEKLMIEASTRQMNEKIDAEIAEKGSILFGEDVRITKVDNLYKAEVVLDNGKKVVVKEEFINDALAQVNFIQMMYNNWGDVDTKTNGEMKKELSQGDWLTEFSEADFQRPSSLPANTSEKLIRAQAIDFVYNFDLRPETFKEFLLGIKDANGKNLFTSAQMENYFSVTNPSELALRFDVAKMLVNESKNSIFNISENIKDIVEGFNKTELTIYKNLLSIPQGKESSLIDVKYNISIKRFSHDELISISKLVDLAKENKHPLLNRDNVMYLFESSIDKNMDLLVEALKVKDAQGNFVVDKNIVSILEREHDSVLESQFEKLIALNGKVDGQIFKDIFTKVSGNSDLRLHLVREILDNRITSPEQIDARIENYYNSFRSTDYQCNFKTAQINDLFAQARLKTEIADTIKLHRVFECYEVVLNNPEHRAMKEFIESKGLFDLNDVNKFKMFNELLDAYSALKGIQDVSTFENIRKYFVELKKHNPSLAKKLESEGFSYKQDGSNFEKASPELRDMIEAARTERLKNVFANKKVAPEIKDFLYEEYLNTFPCEDVYKNKCREIDKKYGVKVIMGAYKEVEALDFVREELQAFKDASGGTAAFIDVFDFTISSYADYANPKGGSYGRGVGGYRSRSNNTIGVKSGRFSDVAHVLRHELMHANDLKCGWGIDSKYNWDEIAIKDKNGEFDLSKCKYVEDFRRIGIPEWHIDYAYNNFLEFIAVAAEGDLTKCTPEFKQVLIDFGMPEWMFRIRSHKDAKAQAGVSFETICKPTVDGKLEITPEGRKIIEKQVEQIRTKASKRLYEDVQFMYDFGLGNPRSLSYRTKGAVSMFDKIQNYLFDNAKKSPSLADAILDIRDANGMRTVIDNVDYSSHPEVKSLLAAGDKLGAARRAAELQSQPYVDRLMGVMTAFKDGRTDKKPTRISNYMGADGVPYFSEKQLRELQLHAKKCGINLSIVTEFDIQNNSHFSEAELAAYKKGRTTKVREAGYTALQVNFENADGTIFEWQLRGKQVDFFAEIEHMPYDLRTNKDISGGNPELAILLDDTKELLKEDNIKPEDYADYNKYLTAHYRHLRYLELGIESEAPKLPEKFDARLKVENLELLHDYMVKVKKGEMDGKTALVRYMQELR